MRPAKVYPAIHAVGAAFAERGIAKDRINTHEDYAYRAIDDVLVRLAPLLAEHRLCILPRVLARQQERVSEPGGEVMVHVALQVAFDLVSADDGSSHTIEAYGEALDGTDKATAKAMTSAYKHAVLQAFCVPVSGSRDPQSGTRGRRSSARCTSDGIAAPVNGWVQWSDDIAAVVDSCVSASAIDKLIEANRALLAGLAREQPALYQQLGATLAARRAALGEAQRATAARRRAGMKRGEAGERGEGARAEPAASPAKRVHAPDTAARSRRAAGRAGKGAAPNGVSGTSSPDQVADLHG